MSTMKFGEPASPAGPDFKPTFPLLGGIRVSTGSSSRAVKFAHAI